MKRLYFLLFTFLITAVSFGQDMVITGAFDGPLTGGVPKVIEIYVINDIADLSTFGVGSANNGGGTDGQELTFAGSATAGDFIYVGYEGTNTGAFSTYFGITADYLDAVANNNGDDALELFSGGVVIDTFGDISVDGTGQPWEYLDGWAYRNTGTGPDGTTFTLANWSFSGPNAVDGCTTNAACASVFPIGTYSPTGSSCGISLGEVSYLCSSNTIGDNNDGVTIQIPYTGSDAGITSVTTTSSGSVFGDDPASDVDGTIVITGLSEGDAWNITLNGGDCDGSTTSGTVPAAECDPTPNTCFDISGGSELFELVAVTTNSELDEWTESSGVYAMNGYCGSTCTDESNTWLIFGPLDMSGVSDLQLIFDATEGFDGTDLNVQYTSDYSSGCPSGATWTSSQTISTSGNYSIDLSSVSGTDVFIGIQYLDSDGTYSSWTLSNVELAAFGTCPTLGTRPTSNCATCDLALQTENYVCLTNTTGDNNDGVTIEIPYTGSENTITSVSTTSSGTIGGDNPSSVADGTITITGLSEGDAWDLTINGGDCDGTTVSGTVPSSACDPVTTDLIINEILADPDSATGDANGDGTVSTSQDEFIELFNIGSSSLDISGYTIEDAVQVRHTFPASTIIPANSFITVFGGGVPAGFTGLVQVASSSSLGLNNAGDTVTIKNSGGAEVATYTYGSEAGNNQSIARDPDFTGSFVQHTAITANPVAFSPDTKNDGTALAVDSFELKGVTVYPNPTNTGFVTISSPNGGSLEAKVFDILGKQVLEGKVENNQLNVSGLNAGMYMVKLTQNNASIIKKLIIK